MKKIFAIAIMMLLSVSAFAEEIRLQAMSDGACYVHRDGQVVAKTAGDATCNETKNQLQQELLKSNQTPYVTKTSSGWTFKRVAVVGLGGGIGALLGSTIGKGTGKTVATVLGGIGGGVFADTMYTSSGSGQPAIVYAGGGNPGYSYYGYDDYGVSNLALAEQLEKQRNALRAEYYSEQVGRRNTQWNECFERHGYACR